MVRSPAAYIVCLSSTAEVQFEQKDVQEGLARVLDKLLEAKIVPKSVFTTWHQNCKAKDGNGLNAPPVEAFFKRRVLS